MNWKRIYIYFLTLFLSLLVTLLQTQIDYSDEGYRATGSLHFAEIWTYLTVGWAWFLPLFILTSEIVYKKRLFRILIFIVPLIVSIIYYRTVNSFECHDTDYRLYAGYLYTHPYFLTVICGIFIGIISAIGIIEGIEYRKRKKLTINI